VSPLRHEEPCPQPPPRVSPVAASATRCCHGPNAHLSFADAGYVLAGPSLSVREDDLVDPYPHQPRDIGQISRRLDLKQRR
jgi:hypothetical protein